MCPHASFKKERTYKTAGEDKKKGCSMHLTSKNTSGITKNPAFNTGCYNNQCNSHHRHHAKADTDCFSAFKPANSCAEGTTDEIAEHRKDDKCDAEEENGCHLI